MMKSRNLVPIQLTQKNLMQRMLVPIRLWSCTRPRIYNLGYLPFYWQRLNVVSHVGDIVKARVDQGSEISLISERLVQLLRLPRSQSTLSLVGVGAQKFNKTKVMVSQFTTHNSTSLQH